MNKKKFIKLTSYGGRIVYVVAENIISLATRKNGGSSVIVTRFGELQGSFDVNESPEEIMALINAEVING